MNFSLIDANYVNFAWSYQNNGILILSNGDIMKYKFKNKNLQYNLGDKLKNSDLVGHLPQQITDKLFDLLSQSRNSVMIDKGRIGFDGGHTSYTGYIFNDHNIEKIELALTGDSIKYNPNPSAIELVKQINHIEEQF